MSSIFSRSHQQLNSLFRQDINDFIILIKDINLILSNINNLTNNQKLDYCNSQRYYIKLYLKEVLK